MSSVDPPLRDGDLSTSSDPDARPPLRHVLAVCATAAQLSGDSRGARVLWDSRALYRSMLRWGAGSVVPIRHVARWQPPLVTAARGLSHAPGTSARWRSTSLSRALRDLAQSLHVDVPPDAQALYGHITFPTARHLPTLWSTQGVLDANPGIWFPEQSARTHERFAQRASAVQCWSELGRRGLLERADRIDESRVRVVPPLVYVDLPHPRGSPSSDPQRSRHSESSGDPDVTAVFVGAEGHRKGLLTLLAAMGRIGAGVRLRVVTADPRPAELPSSVTWLGSIPREQVLAELCRADIHVLPSQSESFGGVVVEALAAGLAQILAASSVPAEIAGPTAVLADARDPASLADAIETLAGDPSLRLSLGMAAKERYDAIYSPAAVGPKLAALVELACGA
ncbi:MAG: glycosyltransferase family 4 protein [Acidimicrobiales bacterium]